MTFREFALENGELQTRVIADRFGLFKDRTLSTVLEEWKEKLQVSHGTGFSANHKIWQYYETRPEIKTLYNTLGAQASQYAMEYLKDDELSYYYDGLNVPVLLRNKEAALSSFFVVIPFYHLFFV